MSAMLADNTVNILSLFYDTPARLSLKFEGLSNEKSGWQISKSTDHVFCSSKSSAYNAFTLRILQIALTASL
jgi:hypothetical protein